MEKLPFLIFACVFSISFASNDGTLVCLQFLHRHGDRAPLDTFPTDPYSNERKYWPNGWGQLTERGKERTFNLGMWIRKEYGNFVPRTYYYKDLLAQSTGVERVIMSGGLVLAGWYPKYTPNFWFNSLHWQPIPIQTKNDDAELTMSKSCSRYDQLYDELLKKLEPTLSKYSPYLKVAADFAGLNSTSTSGEIVDIVDALTIHSEYGLPVSQNAKAFFPKPLKDYEYLYYQTACMTKPLQRLKCGPLLKEMISYFDQCVKKNTTYKAKHYSAHDTTVLGLAQCLGFTPKTLPPYAATIFLELREKHGESIVVVKYKTNDDVTKVDIPGCDKPCTLDKLHKVLEDVIPDDWEKECQL